MPSTGWNGSHHAYPSLHRTSGPRHRDGFCEGGRVAGCTSARTLPRAAGSQRSHESGRRAAWDYHRMQVWAGQAAAAAKPIPAADLLGSIWREAETLL
jgi:hypothetical protein